MEEILAGLFGLGFSIFFIGAMLVGLIDFLGKLYTSFDSLTRDALTSEQKLIYLAIIWFIPFGWLFYILLNEEKTEELFSEVEFL